MIESAGCEASRPIDIRIVLWNVLYAFRSPLWKGLDNRPYLHAAHAGKAYKCWAFTGLNA